MKRISNKSGALFCGVLLSAFYLAGCSSSSSSTPVRYDVKVVNATNNQPLSPVAVVAHSASYSAWDIGSAASTELEYIAEGGSNSQLLAALSTTETTSVSGAGAIGPGGSETISITPGVTSQTQLTIVSMLVNTNDAFAGLRSIDVSELKSGESITVHANVYDAGTELDSESLGTIPGPADSGEGFNAARSDTNNVVRYHGGVVTSDDGLSSSILNQSHRFDNPSMMVTITRM